MNTVNDDCSKQCWNRSRGIPKVRSAILILARLPLADDLHCALDWPTALLLLSRVGISLVILLLFQSTVYGSPSNRVGERDSSYFASNGILTSFASAVILTSVPHRAIIETLADIIVQKSLLGRISNTPRRALFNRPLDPPTPKSRRSQRYPSHRLFESIQRFPRSSSYLECHR